VNGEQERGASTFRVGLSSAFRWRRIDFFGFNLDVRQFLITLMLAYFMLGPQGGEYYGYIKSKRDASERFVRSYGGANENKEPSNHQSSLALVIVYSYCIINCIGVLRSLRENDAKYRREFE
jgi:hypothetical protein